MVDISFVARLWAEHYYHETRRQNRHEEPRHPAWIPGHRLTLSPFDRANQALG